MASAGFFGDITLLLEKLVTPNIYVFLLFGLTPPPMLPP